MLIERNGFQDIVQYADKDKNQVFFPVDNTSESNEAFKKIRSNVNSLIYGREEFAIEYPVSYLLLCLDLQGKKKNILTLGEFRALASTHGIEGDDVFHFLQFLHLRIGIVRYYDVEGLRDIVVIEPQVLFNTITDLVVKTFSCKALTTWEVGEFEKKGLFTASILQSVIGTSALSDEISGGDNISAEKFIQLLVHLRIITPFTTSGDLEEKFFIPCVLNHVPESSGNSSNTSVLPLAVKFRCHHCPKGVFGVLVTHLMTPNKESARETRFSLIQDKIFKDQVSFQVISSNFVDELSLTIYSSHMEVNFFPGVSEYREEPMRKVCCNVREVLEESIVASLGDLHYSEERVQPEMCFRCQYCPELHEVTKGKEFHRIYCSTTRRNSRLPPEGMCWYGEEEIHEDPPNSQQPEKEELIHSASHMKPSSESDQITGDEFTRASTILKQYSHKWREIGELLGFKAHELDNITARPILLLDAPNSYLSAMLSEWQLWAPGDHRGSNTYATLHSLRTAVDKAGLRLTAQKLD